MQTLVIFTAIVVFGGILFAVYDALTHKKTTHI